MGRRIQIAVVGASSASERGREAAYRVGFLLARRGAVVVCGGMGGVMEAACRGVAEAGGIAVAIVPGSRDEANPWASAVVSPGMGYGRNWVIVNSADGVVAVEGQLGTLSELCLAAQLGLPMAGLFTWDLPQLPIRHCGTPEEAVDWIMEVVGGGAA